MRTVYHDQTDGVGYFQAFLSALGALVNLEYEVNLNDSLAGPFP
jgi:hypothetical protein